MGMLLSCGHSYAGATPPAEVKQAARAVCPSNEEDGVLSTLETLFG